MKALHVIGDSISMHYGPYLEKFMASSCKYSRKDGRVENLDLPEGANGGDSSMVLEYLRECMIKQLHWDLLVINCGLHDIKKYNGKYQINSLEYKNNLEQIFDYAKTLCRQIIWVRTTPVFDDTHNSLMKQFERYNVDVEKYNKIADNIAQSHGLWIIDLYSFCHSFDFSELYDDHVHFKTEIQKLQGAYIAGHINTILKVMG